MTDRALRIMFLTHYFPPEIGAPQARMFELAKRLNDLGDEVTVVTAFPNYPTGIVHEGYRGRFAMEERIDGVILGGTELPLLLSTSAIAGVPALDTTALHVAAIVKRLRHTDTLQSDTHV